MATQSRNLSDFLVLRTAFAAVLVLATCAISMSIWRDRADSIDEGVRDVTTLARVFGEQITQSIRAVDLNLQSLQGWIGEQPIDAASAFNSDESRQVMLHRAAGLPQAEQIAVVDRHGNVLVSTHLWPTPPINIADRDYFKDLENNDDNRVSISLPVKSRATGRSAVILARRINGPQRAFRGIVLVEMKSSFLEAVAGTLKEQMFSVIRDDGTILIRHPDTEDRAGIKMPAWSPWYDTLRNGGGVYRGLGPFKRHLRWEAVYPLKDYALVVNVSVPEWIVLEKWRTRTALTVVGALLFLTCAIVLLFLITRQYRRLSESEEALDAAINHVSNGLAMFDSAARLVLCNDRFSEIWGIPKEVLSRGRELCDIHEHRRITTGPSAEAEADLLNPVTGQQPTRREITCNDGRIIEVTRHPMRNGGWVSTHYDITERHENERRIGYLAHNDQLTGIPNRSHFRELIGEACERLQAGGPFAVFMLDLDRFKHINDSLGHAAGDLLLKEAAARLASSIGTGDVVARHGGDEFAIIQAPPRQLSPDEDAALVMRESAVALAGRIVGAVSKPFVIDGHEVFVGTSIGIAMAPGDGVDPDDLIKKADMALYKTKSEGRNGYSFFVAEMTTEADMRRELEADLRTALSRGELEVYYQPVVDLQTRRVCGMEALLRWKHPVRGLVMPDQFIAIAEDSGHIVEIGAWVMRTACAEAVGWPAHVKVAVNVSPIQFRADLLDTVVCALIDSGLPPERLELEITEEFLLREGAADLSILHELRSLGVSVALDDFGTGHSSLSYLKMFPFDKIKVDRSFTREVLDRTDCAAIVCAVASLGRALGIATVAEGVENSAQVQALRAAGLTQGQGFLFGRPVPAHELRFGTLRELVVAGQRAG